jgi:hypothetical protein
VKHRACGSIKNRPLPGFRNRKLHSRLSQGLPHADSRDELAVILVTPLRFLSGMRISGRVSGKGRSAHDQHGDEHQAAECFWVCMHIESPSDVAN